MFIIIFRYLNNICIKSIINMNIFFVYILPLSIHILQFFENITIILYINNLFIKNIKKSFITY